MGTLDLKPDAKAYINVLKSQRNAALDHAAELAALLATYEAKITELEGRVSAKDTPDSPGTH